LTIGTAFRTLAVMARRWCSVFARALVLVLALAVSGCSSFIDRQAASSTYRIVSASQEAAKQLPDLQLAREAIPGGIVQLAAFARAYPEHRGFRQLYAESVCQYAVAFVFDDWEDASLGGRTGEAETLAVRVNRLLVACIEANLALLPAAGPAGQLAWRQARASARPDALLALVAKVTRAQVPVLRWIASADAVQLALDPMRQVGKLDAILAILTRCAQLAPGEHDADAELLLGTLLAARSQFLGGDDGRAQFAAARVALGEGALLIDVMYARAVAVARQDRALFETTLRKVLEADVARWPERRLSNEIARLKAQRYLAAVATLFPQ
jgi:TRAP transporter T-component